MRTFSALVTALMFATGPVLANDGPCEHQLPPAHYVNMSTPSYELVEFKSPQRLSGACGVDRVLACAMRDAPVINIMSLGFIQELAGGDYHRALRWKQCLIVHEIAHLNGWRHE